MDKCKFENCDKYSSFNYQNEKSGMYCFKHKLDDMVDVKHKKCNSDFCHIRGNGKYDNYCTHCFANLFPSDPRTSLIQKKSKEIKVVNYITTKYKDWFHDKPLFYNMKGGCCDSRRRIDLRKMINGTLLCIEIDENQHKYYNKEDESNRYIHGL
jgi:hypothetical protein